MREYISKIAPLMREFEAYRLASDCWNNSYKKLLTRFDRYCAERYPDFETLTQEMLDSWCKKRDTENNNSCRSRVFVVVTFVQYLQKRGLTETTAPILPREESRTYIPHAFTADEFYNFFVACDNIKPPANVKERASQRLRRLTLPVFFRLLYSSGIRTIEARLLRRANVDLVHGVLNIVYSKGHDQHFAVLHDSMLKLMKEYDEIVNKIYPNREYFFSATSGKCYGEKWVFVNFKTMWTQKNSSYAVPYELRHNYAIENINSWTDDGFGFSQKLHTLSKSMGHSAIEHTKYYYSLTPRLADVLVEHTNEDDVIPEVRYESYK